MGDINLNDIDCAISDCARLAEFYYNNSRGPEAYDQYRGYRRSAQEAEKAMRQLSSVWSDFRAFMASKADAYDRYVTRQREPSCEGCSCHINPPCSYCTRETEEEEPASVDERSQSQDPAEGLGPEDARAVTAQPADAQTPAKSLNHGSSS